MFPGGMFAKSYFAGTYFPPVVGQVVPPQEPEHHGGGKQRWRKTSEIIRDWVIEQDDQEMLFFLE